MGNCAALRKTPQYVSRGPSMTAENVAAAKTAAAATAASPDQEGKAGEELNLGTGEIPPGSPKRQSRESHVDFVIREVGGIPRRSSTREMLTARNGYFCEVWYENGPSKSLIYRTVTRTAAGENTTIEFSATGQIDKYGDNVVKVPRTVIPTGGSTKDTQLPPFIRIQVFASYLETSFSEGVSRLVGMTTFPVSELQVKNEWKLWMFNSTTDTLIFDRTHNEMPMFVRISVPSGAAIEPLPVPDKRCVIITRGTRGDVQPFVALARGLAEQKNWAVTIVTEMRYRDLVIKNSNVSRGSIHFRPSGGDTECRIDRPLARWFIMQENAAFQLLMLARAEREFFESEPAFSYFTKEAKPDFLLFGFNTANIALILSESFKLPICGFILQPTIIPSKQYPAIVAVGSVGDDEEHLTPSAFADLKKSRRFSWTKRRGSTGGDDSPVSTPIRETRNKTITTPPPSLEHSSVLTNISSDEPSLWTRCDIPGLAAAPLEGAAETVVNTAMDATHAVIGVLKPLLENNIFTSRINAMRGAHGLPRQQGEDLDFKILQNLNVPMICPINAQAFGGRPQDWSPSISLTDFIFLSPGPGNDPLQKLAPKLQKFILDAKQAHAPIVAIGFSSMPVSRTAILGLSSLVAERTSRGARVIALVGVRPSNETTDQLEETRAQVLKESGKLIEIGGAPFGVLFPFCDFLIVHGGLGTSAEAMRAGKPCLITGVLLFDQRFWGRRVYEMGCGPKPIHIKNLRSEIVRVVDKGLTPGNPWSEAAKKIALQLKEAGNGDGIDLNVKRVAEACDEAQVPFRNLPNCKSARALITTSEAPVVVEGEIASPPRSPPSASDDGRGRRQPSTESSASAPSPPAFVVLSNDITPPPQITSPDVAAVAKQ